LARGAVGVVGAAGVAYACSSGLRRSVFFWSSVGPLVVDYQMLKARAKWVDGCDDKELARRKAEFHEKTASRAVDMILSLGGIYVKIGQVASTIGAGLLEDTYVRALRPLQDGVPPRSFSQMAAIIEESVGLPMETLFLSFDEAPVGAASIAQAHRATLANGTECIVKVQEYLQKPQTDTLADNRQQQRPNACTLNNDATRRRCSTPRCLSYTRPTLPTWWPSRASSSRRIFR